MILIDSIGKKFLGKIKMEYFYGDLEHATINNPYYRRVLATTSTLQLVLMSLQPQQEIGMERHPHTTQFIRVESGMGRADVAGQSYPLANGIYIVIPPNTWHNIINTSTSEDLKLYTIYSPPEHPIGKLEPEKED
jgi:mannose-6-phosphate isomerase-like protein (cupin superfamily)